MSAVLEDLHRIKQLRENSADIAVRKQTVIVQHAVQQLEQTQQTLRDYQHWRPQREHALFADIQHQEVKLKQIDDHQAALGLLRERENQLADQVKQAEQALQTARNSLQQAQQQQILARKATAKFAEFVAVWRAEVKREQDYQEDLEMEEFSGQSADYDEVSNYD